MSTSGSQRVFSDEEMVEIESEQLVDCEEETEEIMSFVFDQIAGAKMSTTVYMYLQEVKNLRHFQLFLYKPFTMYTVHFSFSILFLCPMQDNPILHKPTEYN